jgi:hypothetical protein
MQLKGRVTRFSEFAGSGLAITKVGIVSFSCVMRADSGHDPMEGDTLYLEIPDPEGESLKPLSKLTHGHAAKNDSKLH